MSVRRIAWRAATLALVALVFAPAPSMFAAVTIAVTGHLTDSATGDPVASCRVHAIDETTGQWLASPSASPLTDSAGAYLLTGLDASTTWTIRAFGCPSATGVWVGQETDVNGTAGSTVTADLALVDTTAAQLTVTVVSPDDDPLAGCFVGLQAPSGEAYATLTTDVAGQVSWSVQPDTYKLAVYAGCAGSASDVWYDDATSFATATPIDLSTSQTLTIHTTGTPTKIAVTGHLTDSATGDPVASCRVHAIDETTGQWLASPSASPLTDSAGAYLLTGLDASTTWTIRAFGCPSATGVWVGQETDVNGTAGSTVTADLALVDTTAAQLTVTVVSPDDDPLAGCFVGLQAPSGEAYATLTTDVAGQVSWSVQPDTYKLAVYAGCAGSASDVWYDDATSFATATPIDLSTSQTLTIHTTGTPTKIAVTGHLTDSATGDPVASCRVHAIDETTGQWLASPSASPLTDSAGAYLLTGLDASTTWTIRAFGCPSATGVWVGQETDVNGTAGSTVTADLALVDTTAAQLTVTVVSPDDDPLAGCFVGLQAPSGEAYATLTTDVAGQVSWSVQPDTYKLAVYAGCAGSASDVWYDDATSFATATPIDLSTSQTLTWHPWGAPTDSDAPEVSCDAAPTGWHAANVTIHCTATDTGSGLADAGDASFDLTTTVADDASDASASTGSRSVCDVADNCATAGPFTGLQIDRADPIVSITYPTDGASIVIGSAVSPTPSCSDGGSGVAACGIDALDSTTIGTKTVTATATDQAGNTASASIAVTVRYGTCGVQAKSDRNGSTTITFKVCDAAGRNLSSAALAASATALDGPGGPVTLVTPNGAGFVYVAKSRSYQLVIRTAALPRGTYTLWTLIGSDAIAYSLAIRLR